MLQFAYGDVSDASEQPNLMVNEEESGIFRREPLLVSFLFYSFVWFVTPFQLERASVSHYLRGSCCGNTLLLG